MLRTGLRNDDVQALVREVRAARDEGLGPDDAWSRAKKVVQGVEPEVFDGWREHVEKHAEGGTAQTARSITTTNVLVRVVEQDELIAQLKRKVADLGAKLERAVQPEQVAEYEKAYSLIEKDRAQKGAELAEAQMEIARLHEQVEKLNADLASTHEQLAQAEELIKKPAKK